MKRTGRYENRVKINAILIYLMATLLCVGMIYYISNLKNSINYQKNVKYLFYINRDELPCFTFYCEEDGHLMECP